jgi:hypothetical protein
MLIRAVLLPVPGLATAIATRFIGFLFPFRLWLREGGTAKMVSGSHSKGYILSFVGGVIWGRARATCFLRSPLAGGIKWTVLPILSVLNQDKAVLLFYTPFGEFSWRVELLVS